MTINNIKEDNTIDQLRRFKDTHNKKIKTDNDNNDKQSEKASWWINELDSLAQQNRIKLSSNLEDLSDNKKQDFIRDYKICYSEWGSVHLTINL